MLMDLHPASSDNYRLYTDVLQDEGWTELFEKWGQVVSEYLNHMSKDDMDYPTMLKVYELIQKLQSFDRVIQDYNETYFRELMHILKEKVNGP